MTTTATVEKDHALNNAKAKLESIISWHREYETVTNVPDNDPDARNEDDIREEAEQSVLSVEVRSNDWQSVGTEFKATQGRLLLTFGGPACQIIFDLDNYQEYHQDVEIQYQDWFKPWQGYWPEEDKDIEEAKAALEWFVGLFYYGTN